MVETISVEEAFGEGQMSYLAGNRSDNNPFRRGTRQYDAWRQGWTDEALRDAATCGSDSE